MSKKSSTRSSLLFGEFPFQTETLLYVALSAADLFVTWFLLRQQGEGFHYVEANPIARYFLHHWGIKGMVYFKFGVVALVCVITQIIARYRPRTARLVLWFAIVVMIYVVVYSVRLFQAHSGGGLPLESRCWPVSGCSYPLHS